MPGNEKQPKGYWANLKRLPCVNAGAQAVPAFGLVRVTGTNADTSLNVDRPNADGQQVLVNGPVPIPAGGQGAVSQQWPLYAAYDAVSGTPAAGQTWGTANGSYLLTGGKSGFMIQGSPAAARVLVAAIPPGLTVKDRSGAVVDAACVALQMDARGILTVTSSGHTDTFSLADAAVSQAGVVNTLAQAFNGDKGFQDAVCIAGGNAEFLGLGGITINSCNILINDYDSSSSPFAHDPANHHRLEMTLYATTVADGVIDCYLRLYPGGLQLEGNRAFAVGTNVGYTGSISYSKPGGGSGTITVTGGIITAVS